MGDDVLARGRTKAGNPSPETTSLQHIASLLEARHYELAVSSLLAWQARASESEDNFGEIVSAVLSQMGRTCLHYTHEENRHHQAAVEAGASEKLLVQQMLDILSLVSQADLGGHQPFPAQLPAASSTGEQSGTEEPPARPSLWQRVQNILKPAGGTAVSLPHTAIKAEAEPALFVYCLGPFRVYTQAQQLAQWQGIKSKSLFKYLVVNRQHPVPLEVLMDTFWRENDPESARRNLYQAIYLLRQTVQPVLDDLPFILSENGCYGLNPGVAIWLDSELFEAYVSDGRQLEAGGKMGEAITAYETADSLYSGDFLAEDPYEDWPAAERERLKQAHLHALDRLSRYHYNQQNWALASTYYQRILAADNCREDAHRGLMRVYYFQGQRHLALRQYHCCVEALLEELDVDPMPDTSTLHHQIQKNNLHFPSV